MFKFIKRMLGHMTTRERLDRQILMTEESLISNMTNAEHFAAMADSNRKSLVKLRAMRNAEAGTEVVVHVDSTTKASKAIAAAVAGAAKPRLAASK